MSLSKYKLAKKNFMSKRKGKEKTKSKVQSSHHLKGTLEITRSGIGYVVIADGKGDVLVRPGDFGNALHGDIVYVKVVKENINTGRKEGKIMKVVQRKQTEFIGTLQLSTNFAFFIPDTEKPIPDIFIPLDKINGAKNKERVAVRLLHWEKGDKKPVGEVISVLKAEDENDRAMKELLAESGFPLAFGDDVLEESIRLPQEISESEISKRIDFRGTLTFTIDPVDAKDFDDAISIKSLKNDLYEIGVHIADVSHFVEPEINFR